MSKATNGQAPAPANAMPMFYKKPQPLDFKKHETLGLRKNFGLGFAKNVNAVPVNAVEMPELSHAYPIAFSNDATGTPVAILGLRDNENLFVTDRDEWTGDVMYIPAYIRRYPFIFAEIPNTDQLSLCVDADESVIEEGGDLTFFTADGKASPLSQNALEFCKAYHAAAQATIDFGKALVEADLLVDRNLELSLPNNRKLNFSGFRIIDAEKFNALPDDVFLAWRKKGWLPFVHAHLFSMSQWQRLSKLLGQRLNDNAKAA